MSAIKFFKVSSLPGTLEGNSFYFVSNGDYAESYLTTSAGVAKSIGNSVMIQNVASDLLGGSKFKIVDTIAARDALATSTIAFLVLVADASADSTVTSGGALYAFNPDTPGYVKVAEYESMDINFASLSIAWTQLTGRPTSAVADIDNAVSIRHQHTASLADIEDAVAKRHEHTNSTTVDGLGVDGSGRLTLNGSVVGGSWEGSDW